MLVDLMVNLFALLGIMVGIILVVIIWTLIFMVACQEVKAIRNDHKAKNMYDDDQDSYGGRL